eukprot:GHVU01069579.1.p1 GENE.GHVU01069579.1~~GHVU01069579.1.p1  ORF type:complete len:200 (+),score=16.30 GHVU01069579.1:1653-2252(+)
MPQFAQAVFSAAAPLAAAAACTLLVVANVIIVDILDCPFDFSRMHMYLHARYCDLLKHAPFCTSAICSVRQVIGIAQLHAFQVHGEYVVGWVAFWMAMECITSFFVMELWGKIPYVGKLLPAPLLAILASAAIEFGLARAAFHTPTPTVGDVAPFESEERFPIPFLADPRYSLSAINNMTWDGFVNLVQLGEPSITLAM